jgi:hypothetical protein
MFIKALSKKKGEREREREREREASMKPFINARV